MTQLHLVQLAEVSAKVCKLSLQCSNLPDISNCISLQCLHLIYTYIFQSSNNKKCIKRLLPTKKETRPQQAFQLIQISHLKFHNTKKNSKKSDGFCSDSINKPPPKWKTHAPAAAPGGNSLCKAPGFFFAQCASDLMICHLKSDFE